MRLRSYAGLGLSILLLAACAGRGAAPRAGDSPAAPAPEGTATNAAPEPAPADRAALNRAALELGLPLHWSDDENGDGAVDPDELAVIWGLGAPREHWVSDDGFTLAFLDAWARVTERAANPVEPAGPDAARQEALAKEVGQSQFVVIETDFRDAADADRAFVAHMVEAAALIEALYEDQRGVTGMAERIPPDDGLSWLVFFMNQSPWCSAPATEKDERCTAITPRPPRTYGVYPADLQSKPWCADLQKARNAKALTDPFTVVTRDAKGGLAAVPYHQYWDMTAVAAELRLAARAIDSPEEKPLVTYLEAAARAFEDGSWFAADEAWSRMNAENSRWYVRVAPDEVYWEPCNLKAGFHQTFARIDQASLAWQERLEPVKADMEKAIAAMAGAPYQARDVTFHLPDFIEIVLNAGDDRAPRGATIGQSLPNFGPVANEGRGRTVAMTNLYEDPESRKVQRARAGALFCSEALEHYSDDKDAIVMGTVLHEAAHNLGPSHQYRVNGETAEQIFGGPMASTLEELKAQNTALWLTDWLQARGVVDAQLAKRSHVRDLAWTFGHIARGMYDAEGKVKPYSALAAIELGTLLDAGAMAWNAAQPAANGEDLGCLSIDWQKLPGAVEAMQRHALGIKARGDLAAAEQLKATYVDATGPYAELKGTITERYNRWPVATFLYSIRD